MEEFPDLSSRALNFDDSSPDEEVDTTKIRESKVFIFKESLWSAC